MNINFNNNPITTVRFDDILTGECFIIDYNTPNQIICMKTFSRDIDDKIIVNAINLQNGENYCVRKGVRVVPLNAELKVWLLDQ